MPNPLQQSSLSTLMGLSKQAGSSGYIPQRSQDDYELDEMIPEESLFEMQDEIGARGAQSGRAYSVPSRESLRSSGRAGLRGIFGQIAAKNQGQVDAARYKSMGDAQAATIKGAADVESARYGADAASARAQEAHLNALQRQQIGIDALDARAQAGRSAVDAREGRRQQGSSARMMAAAMMKEANELSKRAQNSWDLMGMGGRRGLQQQAEAKKQEAMRLLALSEGEEGGDDDVIDMTPEQYLAFLASQQ